MTAISYIVHASSQIEEGKKIISGLSEKIQNEIESYNATIYPIGHNQNRPHVIKYKPRKEQMEVWKIPVPEHPNEMFYDDEGSLKLVYYGIYPTWIIIPIPSFKGMSNKFELVFTKH